jgi:ABC-type multidrug transport system fused ATPase/permease subunit
MASINKLKKMKTIIIVAHRLSTIEDCNKIYKFQDGTIIKEK